jgi:hypothetical protein
MMFLSILLTLPAQAAHFQASGHSVANSAEPGTARYLHLSGVDKSADPGDLFAELKKRFEDSLDPLKSSLGFSYVVQTSGGGMFGLNLLVEAKLGGAEALAKYLARAGDADFHGNAVHFQTVKEIHLLASLEAGQYVADQDDPFAQTYFLDRTFTFSTFAEFEGFSNEYGFALLNPERATFLGYLEKFVGGDTFKTVRDQVLASNNMVAIAPATTLVLDHGTEAGPGWNTTPFLPFKFFRNCYSPRFENGNCYKPQ